MKVGNLLSAGAEHVMIEITLNGEKRAFAEAPTLAGVIESLELPHRRVAVVRNGEVIHREDCASTVLTAGDAVDIVHMVGGG